MKYLKKLFAQDTRATKILAHTLTLFAGVLVTRTVDGSAIIDLITSVVGA